MTALSMSFSSSTGDPIGLRLAGAEDQDHLRDWRNAHARRFYQQSHVSDESQRRWFEAYLDRPDDFLFMVMEAGHAIGCMGIRFLDREWEVYNVIRGVESTCSKGLMSSALAMMLEFAWRSRPVPVRVEVLADNPALAWYLRNGFVVIDADTRSFRLIHRRQHPLEGGEPMIPVFGSDLGEREIEAVTTCMRSQWPGFGRLVKEFERAFVARLGLPAFAMVDSGSNALFLAARLLDLPPGSEVILPSFTCVSCAQAVLMANLQPVFCDVDLETMNVRREHVEACLSPRTGAVMVVHYAGLPVDMRPILDLGLPFIEDAAHAVDARSQGRACGGIGHVGFTVSTP